MSGVVMRVWCVRWYVRWCTSEVVREVEIVRWCCVVLRDVASGEWRVASGEWRVASGEWRVASGEWRVASGEWRVASGEW